MVRVGRSSSEGAAALFAAAARARREGEVDKAIALYDVLQLRHPAAPESRAADIALGMLHGSRDRPGAALRHFRRYLARSPRGDLATEALWGEAQALASLGRDAEARRSLARLLGEHPESAYAPAARFRLGLTPSAP
jgi:outer membrane protein assembly factor BamD (BamD/ComL family)